MSALLAVDLRSTPLLDFTAPSLQALVESRGWLRLPVDVRIARVYAFVRDEIRFGYNAGDAIPASAVLADGYGQCNTKTTLLMALLRAVGVACRFHGATIDKRLQRGVVEGVFYWLAPRSILHSWAEVLVGDRWVALEGVILDRDYLAAVRAAFAPDGGPFLGYGVGTEDIRAPQIEWKGDDTFIQKTGVDRDLDVYDDPDAFYRVHGQNLSGLRGWLFRNVIRHRMNARVAAIRDRGALRSGACLVNG